ncbi:hypothetical protein BJ742DRAFT_705313 [Cladochytrium replicatum]|nr:hypothetical protein BJ742DRAFT_705313 [Cladochytrium replicatum]
MASMNGHTIFLDWLKHTGGDGLHGICHGPCKCKGTCWRLHWWVRSGMELHWSPFILDYASKLGEIDVLDWWVKSGLALKWTRTAMDQARNSRGLNWWRRSGLEIRFTKDETATDCIYLLDWWIESQSLPPSGYQYYDNSALQRLDKLQCRAEVLQWWKESGLEMKWTLGAMSMWKTDWKLTMVGSE